MGIFDVALLIVLSGFVFYGFFFGLIRTIGSIAGLIAGFFIASMYYLQVYSWSNNLFFGYDKAGKIICFLLLFSIANRLIGFLFALLDSALGIISIIPFVKTINRLAGAALGLAEGGIAIGLVFYYSGQLGLVGQIISNMTQTSQILPSMLRFVQYILPFLPSLIDKVKVIV